MGKDWPTRRQALRYLGTVGVTAIAGCVNLGRGTNPTQTSDPTSSNPPASSVEGDSVQRRISLAEQDTVPDEHALSINVELLRSRVTASETSKLRVTFTNEGDPWGLAINDGKCHIFNRGHGGSVQPEGLWLHWPNARIERKAGQWTRDRNPDESRLFSGYGCGAGRIERGESIQTEYAVWDDYRVEGYMEPDTYRFERNVTVYTTEQDGGQEDWEQDSTFTWGFSLTVKEPSG